MGDDQEFDQSLCECIFSHEFAMRRLLSLIRNGQSACTDNECTDLVRPQNGSGDGGVDNFTFLIFMLIAAVILYLIRPNSLRQRSTGDTNKHSRDNGPNDENDPMVN